MSVNLELPTAEAIESTGTAKAQEEYPRTDAAHPRQGGMKIAVKCSLYRHAPRFVPAGQSTQMIIGATLESRIIRL